MKFNGKSSFKPKVVPYTIKRLNEEGVEEILSFKLSGLPLDYDRVLSKELPDPVPPVTENVKRDGSGKVVKNEFGALVLLHNEKDPVYLQEVAEQSMLNAIAQIFMALRNDENVQFDSKRENFKTGKEFYRAISQELSDLSLSIGDIYRMVEALNEASALTKEKLVEARDAFL